jgi:allantoin racemase
VRIVAVNVNTSETMTEAIGRAARRWASSSMEILAVRRFFGPEAVDTYFEGSIAAVGVADRVIAIRDPYDAVIIAGFGEPGREGLQELVAQPVIDILSWLDVVSGLSRSAEDAGNPSSADTPA